MMTRRGILKSIPAFALANTMGKSGAMGVPRATDLPITDPLEDIKALLGVLLNEIPGVGSICAALLELLWPWGHDDVWDQIRARVEAMINEKIEAAVFSLLKQKLDGIAATLKLYVSATSTGDTQTMMMQFIATNTAMIEAAEEFRNPDLQWKVAPLFAIFSQIHMALLRDVVLHGKNWGWSAEAYTNYVKLTDSTLRDYTQYLDKVVQAQADRLRPHAPTHPGIHRTAIYNYWQPFQEARIRLIADFRVLIQAMDPIAHPGPVGNVVFEDVYSKAYGTADDWDATCSAWAGEVTTPFSLPLANPDSIYIEYFNSTPRRVDVSYPAGKGPLLWSTEARMDTCRIIANAVPGKECATIHIPPPKAGTRFNIVGASINTGSIPLGLALKLADGTKLTLWNRANSLGAWWEDVQISAHKLTTLAMWTRSRYYDDDLGCIVFGFSRDPDDVPSHLRELLYITAAGESDGIRRLSDQRISSELRERRTAFWRDLTESHSPETPFNR